MSKTTGKGTYEVRRYRLCFYTREDVQGQDGVVVILGVLG